MNNFNAGFLVDSDMREGVWDKAVNDKMLWYSRKDDKCFDIKSLLSDINAETADVIKNFIEHGDGMTKIDISDNIILMIQITKSVLSGMTDIALNFVGYLDKYAISDDLPYPPKSTKLNTIFDKGSIPKISLLDTGLTFKAPIEDRASIWYYIMTNDFIDCRSIFANTDKQTVADMQHLIVYGEGVKTFKLVDELSAEITVYTTREMIQTCIFFIGDQEVEPYILDQQAYHDLLFRKLILKE